MKIESSTAHGDRKVYLDVIRIIAAFFVIFNHTNENGFFLFAEREWGSIPFWGYLFFSIFCKVSVYLFISCINIKRHLHFLLFTVHNGF